MQKTILITSAGRQNQLIECFHEDAAVLGIQSRVLAADAQPELSPACQAADAAFAVRRCSDKAFGPALLELCRAEKVDLLVPTIDSELALLTRHKADFSAGGTRVVKRHVPEELFERPKAGFGIPIGDWLRGPLRDWAESLLTEHSLNDDGLFNPAIVRKQWLEHLSGRRNNQHSLWGVLMFQAWLFSINEQT